MKLNPPPVDMPLDEKGGAVSRPWLMWLQNLYRTYSALLGTLGGANLSMPYGQFQSNASQLITPANTPQKVTFSTTALSNGITLSANKITVSTAGVYSFETQLQLANSDTSIRNFWMWMRKNGSDLLASADKFDVNAKHGTSDGYLLGLSTFYVQMAANDYIEIYVACESATVTIEAYAASVSPFAIPAVLSVDLNVQFVSS